MAIHSPPRKLTYDDLLGLPEDGQRHEILDGVHVVTPPPTLYHQGIGGYLYVHLWTFVQAHRLGKVFYAPVDVILSRHDILEPDILFVSSSRAAIIEENKVQGAPDLVVEIFRQAHGAGTSAKSAPATSFSGCWSTEPSIPRPKRS